LTAVAHDERLDLKLSDAGKQPATEAIQRDQQITLSQQDFKAFHAAIAEPFEPNAALRNALEQAHNASAS
jgi:uncharacterized protein (DUF1778 family)